MAQFIVEEVCSATGGRQVGFGSAAVFTGISTDTRTIQTGDLFVALIGDNFDGHNFIASALDRGAAGVVISRESALNAIDNVTVIQVSDSLTALQQLAAYHRRRFNVPVIAVTGSNGKTTTKDMIAAVLSSRLRVLKTSGNFNNEIGLPLTLLQMTSEHQAAVVEMGMRGLGQIRALAELAQPDIGVITNVGETHIELLGSIENIAKAKAELAEQVEPTGVVILNNDDSYVSGMQNAVCKGRIVLYGLNAGASVKAENIRSATDGIYFDCHYRTERFPIFIPTFGKHNIYNALAAISVGLELGLSFEDIQAGIRTFSSGDMRLNIEKKGEYIIINDAYNASPLSMKAAIETLAEVATGRRVAVLGDMLELGTVAVDAHREIGKKLAEVRAAAVITVGELAKYIAQAAQEAGITAVSCNDHAAASQALRGVIKPGDTILIKGSRGMKMEKILDMFI